MDNILVIAAHPDDEVLGCGGTILKATKKKNIANCLILGEGITSRYEKRSAANPKELQALKKNSLKAGKLIGFKNIFFGNFPDNRFDGVELLEIVKFIESYLKKLKPTVIYTHFENDLNIDHRITFEAAMTALRPKPGSRIKRGLSFEV